MSAVDLRCINCDVRLSRLRRHVLSAENDNLVTIIQRWTYPRNSPETDCICHACWELANYQLLHGNGQAHSSQQVGHHCLCINCGRSILRARRRQLVRPNASERERMVAAIISTWIHPHQPTSVDQVCVTCWLRAQRASQRGHPSGPSNINQSLQSGDANNSPGHPSLVNVHPVLPEFQESNLANNEDNNITCINCDMVYERKQQGRSAIIGYCCNCIVGLRTVGCCSHVMSVVWYLAYARHEGTTPPAVFLDNVLLSLE